MKNKKAGGYGIGTTASLLLVVLVVVGTLGVFGSEIVGLFRIKPLNINTCNLNGLTLEQTEDKINDHLKRERLEEALLQYDNFKKCFPTDEEIIKSEFVKKFEEKLKPLLVDSTELQRAKSILDSASSIISEEDFSEELNEQKIALDLGPCYYPNTIKNRRLASDLCSPSKCINQGYHDNDDLGLCVPTEEEWDGCWLKNNCKACLNQISCKYTKKK